MTSKQILILGSIFFITILCYVTISSGWTYIPMKDSVNTFIISNHPELESIIYPADISPVVYQSNGVFEVTEHGGTWTYNLSGNVMSGTAIFSYKWSGIGHEEYQWKGQFLNGEITEIYSIHCYDEDCIIVP